MAQVSTHEGAGLNAVKEIYFDNYDTTYTDKGRQAVIGFESYNEAQDYAEAFGMEVHIFSRRDGQQGWTDKGLTFEDLDLTQWDWGCDSFFPYYSGKQYIDNTPLPHEGDDLDDDEIEENNAFAEERQDIADEIDKYIHKGEFAVVCCGNVDIYPEHSMHHHDDDVHDYVIGCIGNTFDRFNAICKANNVDAHAEEECGDYYTLYASDEIIYGVAEDEPQNICEEEDLQGYLALDMFASYINTHIKDIFPAEWNDGCSDE